WPRSAVGRRLALAGPNPHPRWSLLRSVDPAQQALPTGGQDADERLLLLGRRDHGRPFGRVGRAVGPVTDLLAQFLGRAAQLLDFGVHAAQLCPQLSRLIRPTRFHGTPSSRPAEVPSACWLPAKDSASGPNPRRPPCRTDNRP